MKKAIFIVLIQLIYANDNIINDIDSVWDKMKIVLIVVIFRSFKTYYHRDVFVKWNFTKKSYPIGMHLMDGSRGL